MENITVDFKSNPAIAYCIKCKQKEMLSPKKKITDTLNYINELNKKHTNCVEKK